MTTLTSMLKKHPDFYPANKEYEEEDPSWNHVQTKGNFGLMCGEKGPIYCLCRLILNLPHKSMVYMAYGRES